MIYPPLFKKDSKGSIRTWYMEQYGDKHRTISGQLNGRLVTSEWTTCTPKNEGKKNASTSDEQAVLEIDAQYKKKLKKDYVDHTDKLDSVDMIKPMLARDYDDFVGKISFPVYSQPKLDGFRCVTKPDGLYSRKNEKYLSCPHIERIVLLIANKYGITFDGELYNHDLKEDFNELQSVVMKKKPLTNDFLKSEQIVEYHIYDLVDSTLTFKQRQDKLTDIFMQNPILSKHCVQVETQEARSQVELDQWYEAFLEDGYEGQMVRSNTMYQHTRSSSLLKRKEFEDEEYIIVRIEEGRGNRSGMAGRVTLALPDGRTFGAGIRGGVVINKKLWQDKDKLIGKSATVQRFKQLTPDGIPRFPTFKCVREDI